MNRHENMHLQIIYLFIHSIGTDVSGQTFSDENTFCDLIEERALEKNLIS